MAAVQHAMNATQLAARLLDCDADQRERLIRACDSTEHVALARALNGVYQEAHPVDPARAAAAASSLALLASVNHDLEIAAVAVWTNGMAAIHLDGQMERGVARLGEAVDRFTTLERPLDVAATQVSRLQGLAMLGRYDEAIACAVAARDTFERHGDLLAAGKIEQNLGNIAYRRGRFEEAEHLYRSARERYMRFNSQAHLVQIDNNLGTVLSEEHRFEEAGRVFEEALARAERQGLEVTQTEVRYNLGCLAMFQGRYARALEHLEQARRSYAELGMAHRSARAELELADAYLELNLAPEAAAIAARLARSFDALHMQAERARAIGCHGRAEARLGHLEDARRLLHEASQLYSAEGNAVDSAFMVLVEAQLLYAEGHFAAASRAAEGAEQHFRAARLWGRVLLAQWLRGEALRCAGEAEAQSVLESALADARMRELPQIVYRCLTSLGQLAQMADRAVDARQAFEESVAFLELLRAPLPAEEFRAAFLSDKLTPFRELARLSLAARTGAETLRAFEYVERARSRALVDMLGGVVNVRSRPRDAFEAELVQRLEELRNELQWFYSQLNRGDGSPRSARDIEALHVEIRTREGAVLDIRRRLEQRGGTEPGRVAPLQTQELQASLGRDTALVEYFSIDGSLLAFVVTEGNVDVVRDLAAESEIEAAVKNLRFQINTMRLAGPAVWRHQQQLVDRTRHHLSGLYDMLLRPLERIIGDRRLVVVPHRALHYVPFHALHDGQQYVVQRQAVSYAPSAGVLMRCLDRPRQTLGHPVLVGVADEQAPRVRDEVVALAEMLPGSTLLLDEAATVAEVRKVARQAQLLHLACHGHFRPDNPLFSALRLADGWLTVGDAYELDMQCELVTLSACETGVSAVAPGEELIGLARGFFSAGTPSLLVSLWTVDDSSTAELMTGVYKGLKAGLGPSDALACSQRDLIQRYAHPYYWSAFAVLGRW